MRPLADIAIDAVEVLAGVFQRYVETGLTDAKDLSELQKAVEFRIDALSVVGSPTDDEKRLVRALKFVKSDILQV